MGAMHYVCLGTSSKKPGNNVTVGGAKDSETSNVNRGTTAMGNTASGSTETEGEHVPFLTNIVGSMSGLAILVAVACCGLCAVPFCMLWRHFHIQRYAMKQAVNNP